MKCLNVIMALAITSFIGIASAATAPSGSTAECKDGTYYSGATKRGACSHHGGIKEWYGGEATNTAPANQQTSSAPVGPPASQPQQQSSSPSSKKSSRMTASGSSGQVWMNTDSKVYHCPGTRYYGTTKHGEYMSESEALSQGARADHNKPCSTSR